MHVLIWSYHKECSLDGGNIILLNNKFNKEKVKTINIKKYIKSKLVEKIWRRRLNMS